MKKVCHMSSVHRGLDVRIFHKECVSLARWGYDTHLVIDATAADVEVAARHRVTVHRLEHAPQASPQLSRLTRMSVHGWRCYQAARKLDADLYHFHDPELIPYAVLLALSGKKVIYDAHEDLAGDICSKDWIPLAARRAIAAASRAVERFGARHFSAVITATPYIGSIFEGVAKRVAVVNNYPLPDELVSAADVAAGSRDSVCYVGVIEAIRGIRQMVQALPDTGVTLHVAGSFVSDELEREVSGLAAWERVKYHGKLSRQGVSKILEQSFAGLVTFLPAPNHLNAQPNKMFEYMSAGVPVIASDFPLWRELITESGCGICVNPNDPRAIATAIRHLRDHPEEVARMGNNGRQAVKNKYRWDREEAKLVSLYHSLIGGLTDIAPTAQAAPAAYEGRT
jgi:glycosyltransferase involved in cell wall biosynthesis